MPEGTIIKALLDQYLVSAVQGRYKCSAKGLFRLKDITPIVGDNVFFDILEEDEKEGHITKIQDRKNELIRPRAANVDQVCVVYSQNKPKPDFLLIDKVITAAFCAGLDVIICENKIDIYEKQQYREETKGYEFAKIDILRVSAHNKIGLDELMGFLSHKKTVLAGQSGVGKSSIINSLCEYEIMPTGEVSHKNRRGKHTTRHTELIELHNGGYIIDTPGFSNHDILEFEAKELKWFYPEFSVFEGQCRFNGCLHINEPGCLVKQAVEKEEIGSGRYERYLQIYDIIKEKENRKYK